MPLTLAQALTLALTCISAPSAPDVPSPSTVGVPDMTQRRSAGSAAMKRLAGSTSLGLGLGLGVGVGLGLGLGLVGRRGHHAPLRALRTRTLLAHAHLERLLVKGRVRVRVRVRDRVRVWVSKPSTTTKP